MQDSSTSNHLQSTFLPSPKAIQDQPGCHSTVSSTATQNADAETLEMDKDQEDETFRPPEVSSSWSLSISSVSASAYLKIKVLLLVGLAVPSWDLSFIGASVGSTQEIMCLDRGKRWDRMMYRTMYSV